MEKGCKFGSHRVLEPSGALPQSALKLDNTPKIYSNEILIDVGILNISATAFTRIEKLTGGDLKGIAEEVIKIVNERGKFQCPDTGSGGMLIGNVDKIGLDLNGRAGVKIGDKIATMVSLSLTPLFIEKVLEVNVDTDQLRVKGKAVLFESGIYAAIPEDLPESLSVAVMDVAGAPAWTAKYVKAGDIVVVIGAGKAGLLCLHEAHKRAGITGKVIAIESQAAQCELVERLQLADIVIQADAAQPVSVMQKLLQATGGRLADFIVNTVNVPNTEMASILACRDHGTLLFFSMSTNFAKAALGCEGVGKVLTLLIGTGYTEGHADITFQILRENSGLRQYFHGLYK
ncbi:L-erythro-3,5-diaminohexanoate dehydrogenase [Cohnella kolymensis]|uniref:L-erythro-3,5-diaminohexanoate dehydrogenase n=1 Tax=Cohnella kolymensis TaxID=1590652 RepID=A0ABR5A7U5_9BACL|nr:zinc-binding dehydrogenase [Cohnella kolymensis]KIL37025.1 L-erythro-3,5-diaminohexanoate dehydrogenase [Cohnella kolymensis]